ncbi:MAG: hypothetical protein R6U46_14550 [Marinilabilia sp.]
MNKDTNHSEEQTVRQLFKTSFKPDDAPSEGFKKRVMDQVMSEWVSQSQYYEPLLNKQTRWWMVPGIITLFVFGYFLDMSQMTSSDFNAGFNILGDAFKSLYTWIEPVHLLIIAAFLAVGLLLMFDHLLQKLSNI